MRSRLLIAGAVALLMAAQVPGVLANEVKSSATVKNKDPSIESILLLASDDDPGTSGLQLSIDPGAERVLPLEVEVSDANGWNDLSKVNARLLDPTGVLLHERELVRVENGHGRLATFNTTYTFPFWMPAGEYTVEITVKDKPGARVTSAWTFEVVPTLAMVLDARSISFGGDLEPGQNNSHDPASVVIRNMGNTKLDLGMSGSDLTNATFDASIPADKLRFSLAQTMENERSLTRSLLVVDDFDLAPGADAAQSVYFALYMPTGDEQYVPAATYRGSLILSAVVSE